MVVGAVFFDLGPGPDMCPLVIVSGIPAIPFWFWADKRFR